MLMLMLLMPCTDLWHAFDNCINDFAAIQADAGTMFILDSESQ